MSKSTFAEISQPRAAAARESPLVSVVVVCYNQAHYLTDALESVLAQTYEHLEIFVVDDGSTDSTAEVAREYPSARSIQQSNQGLSAARNTGLRAAKGEYVLFLDADDKLLPQAVEAGLACFEKFPGSAFVFGAYRNIFDDGAPAPTDPQRRVDQQHFKHLLESNFIGMHGAVIYRRELVQAEGGFEESLRACEDYDLYLRLCRRWPAAQHAEVVAEYRQHDTNMSKDHAFMLRAVLGVLRRQRRRLPDREHSRALRRGLQVWRDYYANLMFEEWKIKRGRRRLLEIARAHPVGFLRRATSALRRRTAAWRERRSPRLGDLRRLSPVSSCFGWDRGLPVDRYYIETFLAAHAGEIQRHVLEIGSDDYSQRFGGERIERQDVLHFEPGFPGATLIADLSSAPHIPDGQFDCIILTQTLHYIFDLQSAVSTLHRILKPGGVVLATLPGISRLCTDQSDKESDCWRFTAFSARRLFSEIFGASNVQIETFGNVLTAISFLQGLAAHELQQNELDFHDPEFPVTIAVAAVKVDSTNETVSLPFEDHRAAVSPHRFGVVGPVGAVRHS